MGPIAIAAIYGLLGGLIGNLFAAITAIGTRRRVPTAALGTALGASGGFILGAAFFDLIDEARGLSRNDLLVGGGIAAGLLLMVGLGFLLGAFGLSEEGEEDPAENELASSERVQRAHIIAIGEGIHNIPEALPIGAALVISPHLSLLIALLMTIENFAESGAIAGELVQTRASNAHILWWTIWPGLLSVIGAPLGVILAGISPLVTAFTLSLAGGIMLFITGDVWVDSQRTAGRAWSSVGLLVGILLALLTTVSGPS